MPDVFGIEGGGTAPGPNANQGAAAPGARPADPHAARGESAPGRYLQYDNEAGAMILNLPAHLAEFRAELQEDLMDLFYGEAAGGKDMHDSIDAWIAEWIERKSAEAREIRGGR